MAKKRQQTDNSLMILAVIAIVAIVVLITTNTEMTTSAGERGKKIVKEQSAWDQFVKNMEPPAIDDPRGEGVGARGYGGGGLLGGSCPACETVILNGKKVTRCYPPTDEEIADRGGGPGGRGNGPGQLCGCFCNTELVWENDGNWYPGLGCLEPTIPLEGMTGAWGVTAGGTGGGAGWWQSNYKCDFQSGACGPEDGYTDDDYYCVFFCGDNEPNPGDTNTKEMCDSGFPLLDPDEGITPGGENLGGQTCASVMGEGWTGTLSCNNLDTPIACRFNKTDCAAPEIYGCMNDVNACNYDSDVTIDDESCYGPYDCADYGGCGGSSVCDTDAWCSDTYDCADYGGCGPSSTCSTGVCGSPFDCTSGAYGDIYGCGSTNTCFVSDCSSPDQCGVCGGDGASCCSTSSSTCGSGSWSGWDWYGWQGPGDVWLCNNIDNVCFDLCMANDANYDADYPSQTCDGTDLSSCSGSTSCSTTPGCANSDGKCEGLCGVYVDCYCRFYGNTCSYNNEIFDP